MIDDLRDLGNLVARIRSTVSGASQDIDKLRRVLEDHGIRDGLTTEREAAWTLGSIKKRLDELLGEVSP